MKWIRNKYVLWILIVLAVLIIGYFIYRANKNSWKRKLADLAIEEHAKWQQGSLKETAGGVRSWLSSYWAASTGPDYGHSQPWSAAFISWLFKSMGAGDKFPYSTKHSTYIRKALSNRKAGKKRGIIAYQPNEYSPKIGDLVCYPRQSGISFFTDRDYASHCDIVVDIDKASGRIITIGGNVSDSVSKTIYDIDNTGRIQSNKVHAILKNAI